MAVQWPLVMGRPVIEVDLLLNGQHRGCRLVADTGAGSRHSIFELILGERDCIACGGILMGRVQLGGAYCGSFPVYLVQVQLPALNFDEPLPAVGAATVPQASDGIAGFKFLNRFQYGNFGNADEFGLDVLPPP